MISCAKSNENDEGDFDFDVLDSLWRTFWWYNSKKIGKEWNSFGRDAIKIPWESLSFGNEGFILILMDLTDFHKDPSHHRNSDFYKSTVSKEVS